jgi:2-polyprenyl-3-methyl-5-hydroxy-6-metoxy-1,4-benzoquinol methylase
VNPRAIAKQALLKTVGVATRRHPVLLPQAAADDARMLDIVAPYRVEGERLTIDLLQRDRGELRGTLLGYDGHFPTVTLWQSERIPYNGPARIEVDLASGDIRLDGTMWGRATMPLGRRFCWTFELTTANAVLERTTGHYRAQSGRAVEKVYYYGDGYVDYAAESAGEYAVVLGLMREWNAIGPVLDVGCATGGLLECLREEGFDVVGVDMSAWAVDQATVRLHPAVVARCDVETESLPPAVTALAPFGTVVLWAVLEHFHTPASVLRTLTALAQPGSVLLINTTNADSLSHRIFDADWEGYFDWTHHSVDTLTVSTLASMLNSSGWDVAQMATSRLWTGDADPLAATLRDWWAADARFRRLLVDRDLGDFVTCVAIKR